MNRSCIKLIQKMRSTNLASHYSFQYKWWSTESFDLLLQWSCPLTVVCSPLKTSPNKTFSTSKCKIKHDKEGKWQILDEVKNNIKAIVCLIHTRLEKKYFNSRLPFRQAALIAPLGRLTSSQCINALYTVGRAYCTSIAEFMGLNPIVALKNFST